MVSLVPRMIRDAFSRQQGLCRGSGTKHSSSVCYRLCSAIGIASEGTAQARTEEPVTPSVTAPSSRF
jgi:hypothetical protein